MNHNSITVVFNRIREPLKFGPTVPRSSTVRDVMHTIGNPNFRIDVLVRNGESRSASKTKLQ
jgi:hypothetical protein